MTRIVEEEVEVTRVVEVPVRDEVTRIVEVEVEVTREVEVPITDEETRFVEVEVEVTREIEVPVTVEVTRIVEVEVEVTRVVEVVTTRRVEVDTTRAVEVTLDTTAIAVSLDCVFCDSFFRSDDVSLATWPTGPYSSSNATGNRSITNGVYEVEATAISGFVWNTLPPSDSADSISDFYLTVEVDKVSGASDAQYGVVFRYADSDNYYMITISEIGQVEIWARIDDEWDRIEILQDVSAIRPGSANQLTVSGDGSHLTLWINGEYVWDGSDSRIPRGTAGLTVNLQDAGDQVSLEFDDFELRAP